MARAAGDQPAEAQREESGGAGDGGGGDGAGHLEAAVGPSAGGRVSTAMRTPPRGRQMVDGWTVTAPEAPTTIPSRLRRKASSAPHGNRAIPAVGVHPPVRILPRGVPSKVTPALAALLDMSVADIPTVLGDLEHSKAALWARLPC